MLFSFSVDVGQKKNASVPSFLCWDRSDTCSCGATRLDAKMRPLSARQHAPVLVTEIPSGPPTCPMAFGSPSKAHSLRPSPPRSHHSAALCRVSAGRTHTFSTVFYKVAHLPPLVKKNFLDFRGLPLPAFLTRRTPEKPSAGVRARRREYNSITFLAACTSKKYLAGRTRPGPSPSQKWLRHFWEPL